MSSQYADQLAASIREIDESVHGFPEDRAAQRVSRIEMLAWSMAHRADFLASEIRRMHHDPQALHAPLMEFAIHDPQGLARILYDLAHGICHDTPDEDWQQTISALEMAGDGAHTVAKSREEEDEMEKENDR